MAGLQRNLGLSAVVTVSLGAMIGSGVFVLPGLAAKLAGPGAILAYVLAGLVVLPAALSKSEMATAMPVAGGAYLYIDRAMGPLMGTIAGFGVWFAGVFKAAFALVGLGAYLMFFADLPIKVVGIALAILLTGINAISARQSGGFQTIVVLAVLGVLGFFLADGTASSSSASLTPFLPEGTQGLLAATALLFISYAGIQKVTSIAEEVKDPDRTVPAGMLLSVGLMIVLYPAVTWVMLRAISIDTLASSATPVTTAAETFMGRFGVGVLSATAVLALISLANAGVLAASRYPLAMARNRLAPAPLAQIHARTGTPVISLALTGGVMVGLIAFVPLLELAKLASAFQVLVFVLNNLSLLAFREANPAWYRPAFRSPLYPWAPIFSVVASLVLLTQLGLIPIVGAVGIVAAGVGWYRWFGRSRASHESAALDAIRLRSIGPLVDTTSEVLKSHGRDHIVIPVSSHTSNQRLSDLLRLAKAMSAEDGRITLARMDRERHGALWWRRDTLPRPDDPFRLGAKDIADTIGVDIAIVRPRGSDARHALVDYADRHAVDLILGELPGVGERHRGSSDLIWIQDHAHADVMYLGNQDLGPLETITVLGAGSPFDVGKIDAATRVAHQEQSAIQLLHVLEQDATEVERNVIAEYHHQLSSVAPSDMRSIVDTSASLIDTIRERVRNSDLIIMGASKSGIGTELSERISEAVDAPVLVVHQPDRGDTPLSQRMLQRLIY